MGGRSGGVVPTGQGRRGQERGGVDGAFVYEEIGRLKVEVDWLKKSLEPSRRGQARTDRDRTQSIVGGGAMRVGSIGAFDVLLHTARFPCAANTSRASHETKETGSACS